MQTQNVVHFNFYFYNIEIISNFFLHVHIINVTQNPA